MMSTAQQGSNCERPMKPIFSDSIIHIDLITDAIFANCASPTLIRVSKTCRAAYNAVHAYIPTAYNINSLLLRFFPDPLAFRSLQASTGTLISGSTALQFFERSFFPHSDLDLYVHMRHRREVGRWLIQAGYHFVQGHFPHPDFEKTVMDPTTLQSDRTYMIPGVACLFTFSKLSPSGSELKVQIIVAQETVMAVILGFHSTCVMNVISYEMAYCLFPRATLVERRSLISSSCLGHNRRRTAGTLKYAKRGFRMVHYLEPAEILVSRPTWRTGPRWMDDNESWVIPLNTEGVQPPQRANPHSAQLTHDPVAVCSWYLRYTPHSVVKMDFALLKSRVLQYSYLFSVGDANVVGYIRTVVGAREMQEEQRDPGGWPLDDWALRDEELPDLLRPLRLLADADASVDAQGNRRTGYLTQLLSRLVV